MCIRDGVSARSMRSIVRAAVKLTIPSYEVRPLIQPRLATLSKGDDSMLLVDKENKVADIAFVLKK